MKSLKIETWRSDDLASSELADELRRIAGLVEEGFTSGDMAGGGWWEVDDKDHGRLVP